MVRKFAWILIIIGAFFTMACQSKTGRLVSQCEKVTEKVKGGSSCEALASDVDSLVKGITKEVQTFQNDGSNLSEQEREEWMEVTRVCAQAMLVTLGSCWDHKEIREAFEKMPEL